MSLFAEKDIEMIRSHSLQMEKSGLVPQEVLAYMYENKLFKIYLPEVLGGTMLSLPDALQVIEKASWVDGSFGWLVMIGAGGGFFSSLLPHELNLQLFLDSKTVIAGSGHPTGTATKCDGGYMVSGEWQYCSGSQYASIFTANCVIVTDEPQEAPVIRAFIFRPDQVSIIKDWNAFGLKATGSHSMAVENIFVPAELTFTYLETYQNYDNLTFVYPFKQFAEATISAVAIGIAKHFIEAAKAFIVELKSGWDKMKPERYAAVLKQIESTEASFLEILNDYYTIIEHSWTTLQNEDEITETEMQQISTLCKKAARAALVSGQAIFPLLGIKAIMETATVNQIWRDLQVVSQHSSLALE